VRRDERGFALLGALLIAVIAALFAAVALAAALGAQRVAASDGGHARARAAALAGAGFALHRVCWTLLPCDAAARCEVDIPEDEAGGSGAPDGIGAACATSTPDGSGAACATSTPDGSGAARATGAAPGADASSEVTLERVEPVSLGWPSSARLVRVTARAASGGASASVIELVALRPSAVPRGLSVAEDLDAQADLAITGSGVYVGGVVRGREHVSFAPPSAEAAPPADAEATDVPASASDAAPDHAWGGRWPAAGVHAGGGIWAAGLDTATLDPCPEAYAADTVGAAVAGLVEPPDAAWLASARSHALDPGDACSGGVLRLDRLPALLPTGEPGAAEAAGRADPSAGYVVFVSARGYDGGVVVTGVRDAAWAPVTVVVDGDAVLGADPGAVASADAGADPSAVASADAGADPGAAGAPSAPASAVALRGALVVAGRLSVAAPSSLCGHVACRRLAVTASLSLDLEADWRTRPPVGFVEPVLVARR